MSDAKPAWWRDEIYGEWDGYAKPWDGSIRQPTANPTRVRNTASSSNEPSPPSAARMNDYEGSLPMQNNEPETPESILMEAERIVGGQRRIDYGPCTDSFEVIAGMWRMYLAGKATLTGQDVAMMMALLKICRYKNGGTRDSLVDLAGYASCASQIDEDYARRAGHLV